MKKKKIVIIDDHELFIEGIKNIIKSDDGLTLTKILSNTKFLYDWIIKLEPDIILINIELFANVEINTIHKILEHYRSPKLIFIVNEFSKELVNEYRVLGGKGFISRQISKQEFIKMFNQIEESIFYDTSLKQKLLFTNEKNSEKKFKKISLTKREFNILTMIARGQCNKEISKNLFLSEKTIKNNITQLYSKLDVKDRVNATILAYDLKIIKLKNKKYIEIIVEE